PLLDGAGLLQAEPPVRPDGEDQRLLALLVGQQEEVAVDGEVPGPADQSASRLVTEQAQARLTLVEGPGGHAVVVPVAGVDELSAAVDLDVGGRLLAESGRRAGDRLQGSEQPRAE